jgi:MIP family channel proteins
MASFLPRLGLDEILDDKIFLVKCLVAEMIGTLFLVLVGIGSCIGGEQDDFVRIALAFGVTVATMAQSIGHISGCHINPAVTAGLFFGRKIGLIKSVLYIVFQCIGAVVGAGLAYGLGHTDIRGYTGLGMTTVNPNLNAGQAFGVEFLITFVLVLVVFGAAADEDVNVKGSAPLAIGLSITTCHLFAIPFTGSSMNPARTFGPAVVLGMWENHWVYWLGPILGGICASLIYQLVLKAPKQNPIVRDGKPASYGGVSLTEQP